MSATLSNSGLAHANADAVWSRGGGGFRRLVWKELSEVAGICGAFVLGIVIAALWARFEWVTRREMFSLPILLIHIAGLVFPVIVGTRSFAREIENGTWELLRSAGASAWNVWLSKLLVASLSSLGISSLSGMAISLSHSHGVSVYLLGSLVGWSALMLVLVLTVSMQCSLWLRRVWLAMIVSTALAIPLVYLANYLATGWLQLRLSGVKYSEAVGLLRLSSIAASAVVTSFVVLLWTTQLWQLRSELFDHSAIHDSRRWRQVFWRMVWKELLAARDFWLAVLGIVVLLDGVAWWVFREVQTRDTTLVVVGILMPLLHSLGCGAISFAIEREDGTHDWLRRISAPAGAVYAAKLLVSQASIISLTSLVLFPTQWLLLADHRQTGDACAVVLLAVTLNGVIGLGASMLTRRVLPAMFLAFVGVAAIDLPLLTIAFGAVDRKPILDSSIVLLPCWLLLTATLLAVECWLSECWLNEKPWWKKVWRGDAAKIVLRRRSVAWFEQSPSPEMKAFGRMLWREWHEARCWLWALPIAFTPWLMNEYSESHARREAWYFVTMPVLAILSISLTILPTLWGVWAFHHDQRQGLFRFLSDRGGSPTGIWLSKHAVWLPQVLLLALIVGTTFGWQLHWQRQAGFGLVVGFALVGALQGYAAGQWLAQLIRSPLTSLFLAGVLSLLLAGWSRLLWEIHVPWLYQLVPAATLLLASWVHSRDWLEERWTWRAWLKIVVAVLLPAVELVLALEVQGYPLLKTLRDWPMFR